MTDKTYNGWTNYATWRVNLDTFDGMDVEDMGWHKLDHYELAVILKDYIEELLEQEQMQQRRSQAMPLALSYALAFVQDVNYREIAANMLAAYAQKTEEA